MFRSKFVISLLLLICLSFSSLLAQEMITVYPNEYSGALSNPLRGFRTGTSSWSQYDYPRVVRDYIRWNQIENSASDGIDKIINFCNTRWAGLQNYNIKVIPRVYLDWDSNTGNEYWPADLKNGDWYSDEFKDRVVKLIHKLGEAWDNDPRIAWIQTGLIGYWGEQENPVGVDEDGWAARMGKAFEEAFPNKLLLVRNQNVWEVEGYEWGVYWDSFAHPGQANGSWTRIKNANATGRYLTQVVEGEVAYNWGQDVLYPVIGSSPDATVSTPQYYNYLIDVIRELHCSALGWVSDYNPNDPNNTVGAMEIQKAFGYRFVINEFSCSKRADPGSMLDISFKVKNTGSAPFYEKWPLAFILIDESTKQIVWTKTLPEYNISEWRPGNNYDYISRTYSTPAVEHEITASIMVPTDVTAGQYMAGMTILEPYSRTPGVFFAVENFLGESQTQPLCRVGIGQDVVGGYEVDTSIFADPVKDDDRYYTLEWNGPKYNLTTSAAMGGSVSPGSNTFNENQKVLLKATANLGYEFNNWSGDINSSENPITITMNSNKNVTANFTAVDTFRLTVNSPNGSITLDPPGGVYNVGSVVTITAIPDLGFAFSEWTGDLSDTNNPGTITMDGNKNVTAVYTPVSIYTLTTNAQGGTIIIDPSGPQYNAGTKVKLEAKADFGYLFTRWSGDPLDFAFYINPNYITMNSDKNITAEFVVDPNALNLIKNGDFSAGLTNWAPQVISPAQATISVINKECQILINAVDNETWHINILQQGIHLETNKNYTFNFDARATTNKSVSVKAQFDHDPWTSSIERPVNITNTMQSYSVTWLQEQPADNYKVGLFFGSDTVDVWVDNLKLMTTPTDVNDEAKTVLPQYTNLEQNYPNPFNPTTTINYELHQFSNVSLRVYNIVGQLVKTLIDIEQNQGDYNIQWDGKDNNNKSVAAGMYIYFLRTNDYLESRKMILLK